MTSLQRRPEPAGGPALDAVSWRQRALGVLTVFGVGAAMAGQSRINGALGQRLDDGIAAAVISFGTGLLLLAALVPALPAGRRGMARVLTALRAGTLRPWQCLGGVCGALYVVGQAVSVPVVGVAVFTVAIVAGQVTSSLVVDRLGAGPSGVQPITVPRLCGAALAVVAVLVAMSGRFDGNVALWVALLPALAGVGVAWQQAVNGRVAAVAGAALPSALVNFVAGTVALVVALAVSLALRGLPRSLPGEWWLYLGGPLGAVLIGIAAVVVRVTGVLLLGLGMVSGQLCGAVLLDLVLPTGRAPLDTVTLAGTALTLVAVVVAALPARR